jgi:hypothetical protein
MGKEVEDANVYRVGHPLAQKVLERAMATETPPLMVSFQLTGSRKNIAITANSFSPVQLSRP